MGAGNYQGMNSELGFALPCHCLAVIRNRTRRRLKEAARLVLAGSAVSGVDLVLIGREATRERG